MQVYCMETRFLACLGPAARPIGLTGGISFGGACSRENNGWGRKNLSRWYVMIIILFYVLSSSITKKGNGFQWANQHL